MQINLSHAELSLISDIVNTVNDRCFTPDRKDEDGNWYSNDDFVMMLSNEERELLEKICKRI
jgi:hypothetical protein